MCCFCTSRRWKVLRMSSRDKYSTTFCSSHKTFLCHFFLACATISVFNYSSKSKLKQNTTVNFSSFLLLTSAEKWEVLLLRILFVLYWARPTIICFFSKLNICICYGKSIWIIIVYIYRIISKLIQLYNIYKKKKI